VSNKDHEIKAKVQPRIYSAAKVPLEDKLPLSTPFSAHIDVCSVCNFKCSFCFQADKQAMKDANLHLGLMDMELFTKIVDDLKEFDEPLKKVKIGNHGEPTLHHDLAKMVKYVSDAKVADIVEIFTNGTKLEPKLNLALVEAGLDRINISLEGLTNERYLQVTGAEVDFDEMIKNITHLYNNRGNLKIYIKIADQTSPLDKESDEIFILNEEERQYFFDTFGDICDEIYIEKIVPQWAETQADKQNKVSQTGMYDQVIKQHKDICPFTFMYLHFNFDGTTSPCTLDWPKKVIIGDSYKESAKEIWNGQKLRDLRIAMTRGDRDKINFCNNCSAPLVCVDEYLDPHKDKIYKALNVTEKEKTEPNKWVTLK